MAAVARRRQPRAKQKGLWRQMIVAGWPNVACVDAAAGHSIAVVGTGKGVATDRQQG
jgi:hypothetical protein